MQARPVAPAVARLVRAASSYSAAERREVSGLTGRLSAVLGAQWGDEGKGKLVDILARKCVEAAHHRDPQHNWATPPRPSRPALRRPGVPRPTPPRPTPWYRLPLPHHNSLFVARVCGHPAC